VTVRPDRWGLALCAVVLTAVCVLKSADAARTPKGAPEALLGVWVPDAAPRALLTSDGKAPPLTSEAAKEP